MDKTILRKWLKSGFLEKQVFHDTISGTPQGGIISPVLANLALDGLERRLREVFPFRGKGSTRGRSAQVHLIRYADDFIITGHSRELLEATVKPLVESFLHERGLELSPEKTAITHVTEGFDLYGAFPCQVVVFGLLPVLCSERRGRSSSRRLQSGSRSARNGVKGPKR